MLSRFDLAHDTSNKEVLHQARRIVNALVEEPGRGFPKPIAQIVGATVFGSRTKGDAREDSDIDMTLFVDMDGFSHDAPGIHGGNDWVGFIRGESASDSRRPSDVLREASFVLTSSFRERLTLVRPHLFVMPISTSYVTACANRYMEVANNNAKYHQLRSAALADGNPIEQIADWSIVPTVREKMQPLVAPMEAALGIGTERRSVVADNTIRRYLKEDNSDLGQLRYKALFDNRVLVPDMPTRLFNASIGDPTKIIKYRTDFLRPMLDAGEHGSRGWMRFVCDLKKFEDSPEHPRNIEEIYYPETLDAAVKSYAPDLLVTSRG